MKKYILPLIVLLAVVFAGSTGCKKTSTESKPTEIPEEIRNGWEAFSNGNWDQAIGYFKKGLANDPNSVVAATGLGWAFARKGEVDSAYTYYTYGENLNITSYDLYAGMAFLELIIGEYNWSVLHAEYVISNRPTWSFTYNSQTIGLDLNTSDLRLCLAQDYFWLADFDASLAQVKVLNSSFNADVSTTAGQEALHAEIMRLRGIL
jgi:tetratricopeptide (TPR) repeat protein